MAPAVTRTTAAARCMLLSKVTLVRVLRLLLRLVLALAVANPVLAIVALVYWHWYHPS